MTEEIQKVQIHNRNYGELDGVAVYVTEDLSRRLEKETIRGTPIIKLLEQGRAIQGLKHIVFSIKNSNKGARIIFNLKETRKSDNDYFINYDEYRQRSRGRFFELYQETGFDAANSYLNNYFPEEFKYDPNRLKATEIRKAEGQLSSLLESVSDKEKNQTILLQEANKILRSKLKRKSKELESALRQLRKESNLSFYEGSLDKLKQRLSSKKSYHETSGKECWQNWIHDNNWLFGVRYLRPIPKEKVGFKNIPDFLFPTRDGFLDILEIKKPKCDVIRKDPEHAGSYIWCPDTNVAIGQVVTYIQEMEDHRLEIRDNINESYGAEYGINFHVIRPRAFILVGQFEKWSTKDKEAFRRLNYSLHGIEVMTYSDLVNRGESIIAMLTVE